MERQNENVVTNTTKQPQEQKHSAQADFPVLLESDLAPDAAYCMECGKTHKPGACNGRE